MPKYNLLERGPWAESVEDDGVEFHSKWDHSSNWDKDGYNLKWIAEDGAKCYYNECDGWESWRDPSESRDFDIYTVENKYLGTFTIYLDFEPTFSAVRIKKDDKGND